jgi:hypothetical protein
MMPTPAMECGSKQRQDMRRQAHELLDVLIGEQVMHALGKANDLLKVQVRHLWRRHYRVNVFTGENVWCAKVAHSYFVVANSDGHIIAATPKITRQYGSLPVSLTGPTPAESAERPLFRECDHG